MKYAYLPVPVKDERALGYNNDIITFYKSHCCNEVGLIIFLLNFFSIFK